jgi:hypothetical protein
VALRIFEAQAADPDRDEVFAVAREQTHSNLMVRFQAPISDSTGGARIRHRV